MTTTKYVLVRGNKIEKISAEPIPTDRISDTVMINEANRTASFLNVLRNLNCRIPSRYMAERLTCEITGHSAKAMVQYVAKNKMWTDEESRIKVDSGLEADLSAFVER